ncbi:MAG: hypothetical protein JSV91_14185 [Phycisphaerales bacterium]|nr:MAG: hypothetical protein JSV91_14185 [Phycisphaerales bacterium]
MWFQAISKNHIAAAAVIAVGVTSTCFAQIVNPANGHTYYLSDSFVTPMQGESWAQSLGGHLVTVNDQTEQDWLVQTFGGLPDHFWTGLTDDPAYGGYESNNDPIDGWVWMSGEEVTYVNWAVGGGAGDQPNGGSVENFVWFNHETDGDWNDAGNTPSCRAIAEVGPSCPADLSGDSMVDIDDLFIVLGYWGYTNVPADINGDGVVDIDDIFAVLDAWGPCE